MNLYMPLPLMKKHTHQASLISTPALEQIAQPRFGKQGQAGFTLVEVVLAIGIIAFAFIPLLGLLPLGLDVSRQAIDTTVQAQIAQQLTTQAQQTDFSLLSTFASNSINTPYYFDDQGNKATSSDRRIYEAVISATSNTALPGPVTTQRLATVTIYVLSLTSTQTNRSITDLTRNPDSKKYVVLIPDNGR
jgi:uncharacterized protein (TIGR02598 family)